MWQSYVIWAFLGIAIFYETLNKYEALSIFVKEDKIDPIKNLQTDTCNNISAIVKRLPAIPEMELFGRSLNIISGPIDKRFWYSTKACNKYENTSIFVEVEQIRLLIKTRQPVTLRTNAELEFSMLNRRHSVGKAHTPKIEVFSSYDLILPIDRACSN